MKARQKKKKIIGSKCGSVTGIGGGFRVLKDSGGYVLTCPCGFDYRSSGRFGVAIGRGDIRAALRNAERFFAGYRT